MAQAFIARGLKAAACMAAVFSFALVASAAEPVFNNPLVKQRADPQVSLHSDGYYYFTATAPEYDRIELRRARSLNDLGSAEAKVVWRKHASGIMGAHIWAPEMHHIDGKWYIYFTAGSAEKIWEIRLYVLENSSPNPLEGEWKELGQLKTGWESFSLDATTFAMGGKRYLLWTQVAQESTTHATNIYIAAMDTPSSIKGPAVMLTKPEYDWEKVKHAVNEAPAGGDLLKPGTWSKSPKPVFVSSEANGQYGPGHNSFTTTPDGKTDILVYHARNYRDIVGDPLNDQNRHTRAQVLHWNADGTPNFGQPVADKRD